MDDKKMVKINVKPYTLRKLDGDAIWPVLYIIGDTLPDDLAPIFMELMTGGKTIEEVGAVVVLRLGKAIMKNIGKCKDEVYELLTIASGLNREEINALGLFVVPKMLWDIIKDETNVDFFEESAKSS